MTITITYKAEVAIPEDVYRTFGHTPEYTLAVAAAVKGAATSGSDTYGAVYEWAEDSDRAVVELVHARLCQMVDNFKRKLAADHAAQGCA